MKVLIACEFSGVVTEAFRNKGHNVLSCDLIPSEVTGRQFHYTGDVNDLLDATCTENNSEWDMIIMHPPCTYLCVSGIHWNKKNPERQQKTEEALQFVHRLWTRPIKKKCLENPVGILSTRWRKPDQYIQPYQFGHNASKKTGLWLEGLDRLVPPPELYVQPRLVNGKPRWDNQTDSGQNNLGPSLQRSNDRARTYQGIAEAMAEQWGK